MNIPQGLRKLYQEGRLIPFIGAGVSRSVVWDENGQSRHGPSWSEMVDEVARLLGFDSALLSTCAKIDSAYSLASRGLRV